MSEAMRDRGPVRASASGVRMVTGAPNGVLLDVRGLAPEFRRPIVFAMLEKMMELDCEDSLVVVLDHEPAGLGYQIDLRRETRGRFEYFYDQRLDGAWVALIRRKWE
ncbi:MAG: hypothetical protein C0418_02610 [Coriobacteriaceae bacterium]|nr:hypothetical protein [Coriobacteriaceae bacterium]